LILVAESNGGPTMLARIGFMQALNRHVERVFDPSRKDHHWGSASLRAIGELSDAACWAAYSPESILNLRPGAIDSTGARGVG
jgi:hypothetical protein